MPETQQLSPNEPWRDKALRLTALGANLEQLMREGDGLTRGRGWCTASVDDLIDWGRRAEHVI